MEDPGFPVGGVPTSPAPNAATFQEICMSRRKNWNPLWGGIRQCTSQVFIWGVKYRLLQTPQQLMFKSSWHIKSEETFFVSVRKL